MLNAHHRHTKIVWSFEPSCLNQQVIDQLETESVDALRLVLDNDSRDAVLGFLRELRTAFTGGARRCPVLLDIDTKSRGHLAGDTEMTFILDQEVTAVPMASDASADGVFAVQVPTGFETFFKRGELVYIGYGSAVMETVDVTSEAARMRVVHAGRVFPGTPVHVPATRPHVVAADLLNEDLYRLVREGVDYLVLPGMTDLKELEECRVRLGEACERPPWMLMKIDSQGVYECLDNILDVVDGILISRRELTLTVDPALVPIMTKEAIQRSNDRAKTVVIAAEMLGSMRRNATPTRAEVSDIANSVIDGSDAVVLSEDIPYGRFGPRSVQVMHRIISDVETHEDVHPNWTKLAPKVTNEMDAIAFSAYQTAERLAARAIVCVTQRGNTALKLASFRPPVPIIAVCFDEDTLNRLRLVHGVDGIVVDDDLSMDLVLPRVSERLKRDSWLEKGDVIVFVSISLSSLSQENSNLFTIQRIQ